MSQPNRDECLLSDLAHEFTERLRQGEHPSISEYVKKYPNLANDIREVFPTLELIESSDAATTSDFAVVDADPQWKCESERLGEYRIVREVGRGGMGAVFEAIQEPLGRRVGLKVLPASSITIARQLERFRREARAAASLQHANIVPVYDVGEAEGVHFYAMQFINGKSLSSLLDEIANATAPFTHSVTHWQGALLAEIDAVVGRGASAEEHDQPQHVRPRSRTSKPPDAHKPTLPCIGSYIDSPPSNSKDGSGTRKAYYRQIAHLGRQVAEALAYAHGQGVLHRDIKPSNVLLDVHGNAWVTDFGLAHVAGQEELTLAGDVVGTLGYLSPERFGGHIDERGDIYSLGVTLYQMLAGRPPFAASTRAGLIDAILHGRPASLRRLDAKLPRDLETIVQKAMAPDPSQRYARADLLADDLHCFIADRQISARRLSVWSTTWRWCRRNKPFATAIGLATALLIAVFVISLVDSVRIRNQLHVTRLARREARARAFESLVSQAHARWMGGHRLGRRFETLAVVREATELARHLRMPDEALARLRDEAIGALCLPDAEYAQLIDAFPVGTATVSFDPEIQRYARSSTDGNVTIHRVLDNQLLHQLPHPGAGFESDEIWDFGYSPHGIYLKHRCIDVQRGKRLVQVWDVSASEPRLTLELTPVRADGVTEFSSDDRYLAVVLDDSASASAETKSIYQVHVFDLASGNETATPLPADETTRLMFHPTKAQLAVSDTTAVRIVEWETGSELARWNRSKRQPMAWSPDGRLLLARSTDREDPRIYRWDVEQRRELPPLHPPARERPYRIVFDHQGNRFFSAERFHVYAWEARSGLLLWDFPFGALPAIQFSRDDQLLAGFSGVYPKVRIVRFTDGLELRRFPLASAMENGFPRAVMSADGHLLAATSDRGTMILNLETFEELVVIPGVRLPLVFEPDQSLLTHAAPPEGVMRWPLDIRAETTTQRMQIAVGAPRTLTELANDDSTQTLFTGLERWAASPDGRVIATPWQRDITSTGARIFLRDDVDNTKYRGFELGPQHDVHFTSVSPDGKYVATGSVSWWRTSGGATDSVTVWDAKTGRRVKDLLPAEGAPSFSPDGKWITVTSGALPESVRVFQVGSWQSAPAPARIEGPGNGQVAFHTASGLMAVQGHHIRLLVPETGREVASLSIPEETSLAPQCFTPDGNLLIAFGVHNGQLYVWDLRAIRRQLAELGLDWN